MASAIAVPSAAMQRRITSHLDNGITPSVRGNRVMLKDVVLIKATGERAPAAAEAERQAAQRNISLNIALGTKKRPPSARATKSSHTTPQAESTSWHGGLVASVW